VLVPTTSTDTRIASSVDAERAFSGGRLQVNHLQHGISSQTSRHRSPSDLGSTHPLCSVGGRMELTLWQLQNGTMAVGRMAEVGKSICERFDSF